MKHIINLRLVMLLLGVFLTTGAWAQDAQDNHFTITKELNLKQLVRLKHETHGIKAEGLGEGDTISVAIWMTVKGPYIASCGNSAIYSEYSNKVRIYDAFTSQNTTEYSHNSKSIYYNRKIHGFKVFDKCAGPVGSDTNVYWRHQAYFANWMLTRMSLNRSHVFNARVVLTIKGNATLNNLVSVKLPGIGVITKGEFINSGLYRRIEVYRASNNSPEAVYDWVPSTAVPHIRTLMGDSVVFKSNDENLILEGLADIWIARSSGESKYYCTPSIKMGGYRPFLGYDSKVHGVGLRKYPVGFQRKYPTMESSNTEPYYHTSWIAQRHSQSNVPEYNPYTTENGNVSLDKVKHAGDFNEANFSIGGGETVVDQRNNQREGYNMEILNRYLKGVGSDFRESNLQSYEGVNLTGQYVAGLDGDELLYFNHRYANFKTGTPYDDLTLLEVESWKKLQPWESSQDDPISMIAQTYQSNRMAIEGASGSSIHYKRYISRYGEKAVIYKGYEIFDKQQYVYDPTVPNAKKYFHHKRPIVHTPGGASIPEKGLITWDDGLNVKNLSLSVAHPSGSALSFYGTIEGDEYPSRGQLNVFYSVPIVVITNRPSGGVYTLEYTNEDELGFLNKQTVDLVPGQTGVILRNDRYGAEFHMGGGGYHEVTLSYRRNANASPVIIAGKELRVIDLRFVSAPGTKEAGDFAEDGSIFIANDALDLKEGRGDGKNWYLRERVQQTAADVNTYGDKDYSVTRTYTFAAGDKVVFNAIDADPHNFRHYDTEWYVSQRVMSKCLTDEALVDRIVWKVDDVQEGMGRYFTFGPMTAGTYTLESFYNGVSGVKHEIVVLPQPYVNNSTSDKGKIEFYNISENQKSWLREFLNDPTLDLSDAKVAKVQNIFSQYTYADGARAPFNNPGDRANRYGPENDYNAKFQWLLSSCQDLYYAGDMIDGGSYPNTGCTVYPNVDFPDFYTDGQGPEAAWFPTDWIRHFSDKPYPSDINSNLIVNPEQVVNGHWPTDAFEPWQWRLPWIAKTAWHGYRTRWNIKAVYNMGKIFNDHVGAFSGRKFDLTDDEAIYRAEVYGNPMPGGGYDGTKILPGFDDLARKKYDFFWDLASGRKLVFKGDDSSFGGDFAVFELGLEEVGAEGPFIASNTYEVEGISSGRELRHLFDNDYIDASGNGINSLPVGTVALTNSTPAQGSHTMYQPGAGGYVDLDRNNAFIHNAFTERTVAFWVNAINTVSGRQDLFDEGGATHGMALRIDGPNVELGVQNSHQIRTVSACFDKNQWVHLAGVFNNGSLQLYINGELVAENTNVGYTSIPAHGNGAGFGATNGGNAFDQVNNTFAGALDDLSIYGRALSGGELQSLMSQANIIPDPNCASSLNLSGSGGSPQVGEIGTVSLDVPANESLKVYPNPSADGNFVVIFDLPAPATVGLEVSALDGRRLVTKSLNKLVAGQHRLRIEETQGLPPGMYLLKVDFGDHVEARKLVVSN